MEPIINTKARVSFLSALSALFVVSLPSFAVDFAGGTGEPNDPYQIATAEQLIGLGDNPDLYDKCFIFTADIDLSGRVFDRAVIAPGGRGVRRDPRFQGITFNGLLNGDGHWIVALTIEGQTMTGLIGGLGYGAVVSNLGLKAVDVNGTGDVSGALAAWNFGGTITNSYSTGTVTGNVHIGGLVGYNENGPITNCYSTVAVTGNDHVGGLVGHNFIGLIANCYSIGMVIGGNRVGGLVGYSYNGLIINVYSTGMVTGDNYVGGLVGRCTYCVVSSSYSSCLISGEGGYVGGIVGRNYSGSVSSSIWDIEVSGLTESDGGMGLHTVEMKNVNTYLDAGWDLVDETTNGTGNVWRIQNGTYPVLVVFSDLLPVEPQGRGTAENPYQIKDANELGSVWYRPQAYYRLVADIDLCGMTWGMSVVPWFSGSFDGGGNTIHNLHIKGGGCLGLFGRCASRASVSNLGLKTASIYGAGNDVGGLVGENYGNITSCSSSGSVLGDSHIGGLVGDNHWGVITASYSRCSISGEGGYMGGLVGMSTAGVISSSYSSGPVSGEGDYAGGLVGRLHLYSGIIISSYSCGLISIQGDYAGGLVGFNEGQISSCNSSGSIFGKGNCVGGLVGVNEGDLNLNYSSGYVTGEGDYIGGLVGYNDGYIQSNYSSSSVYGGSSVGGLVGFQNKRGITSSYSNGLVSGIVNVGGLLGYNRAGFITKCFWDMDTSGMTESDGGTGLSTARMQDINTYLDPKWDFDEIWMICEGDYPHLQWEGGQCDGLAVGP